jgi:RNA polymerase sigma-70 factor (ECF subfamily)
MSEKERVKRVLSGDTSAFAYFVDCYQDMAFTFAYRVCGNEQDAEDIVQESYVKAYRNLHGFRAESKFSTWLYRIVYNTAVTHSKKRLWEVDRETEADNVLHLAEDTLQVEVEAMDRKAVVNDILGRMPTGEALLLTLYYLEDHPVKEIVKITGLNEANVKVRLFRARKSFKELLQRRYRISEIL